MLQSNQKFADESSEWTYKSVQSDVTEVDGDQDGAGAGSANAVAGSHPPARGKQQAAEFAIIRRLIRGRRSSQHVSVIVVTHQKVLGVEVVVLHPIVRLYRRRTVIGADPTP